MTNPGTVLLYWEYLFAVILYVYAAPKRKYFWLKLSGIGAVCTVLAYFIPAPEFESSLFWLYAIARQTVLVVIVLFQIAWMFKLKRHSLIYMVAAGMLTHQIAHAIPDILRGTEVLPQLSFWIFGRGQVFELIVIPVVYALFWATIGRFVASREYYNRGNGICACLAIGIIVINNVLSRLPYILEEDSYTSVYLYQIVAASLGLVVQIALYHIFLLRNEAIILSQMSENAKQQYEMTKETIEAINIKCHDLKHKLYAESVTLGDKSEIQDLVNIYDHSIKTGNETLDIILMDYYLRFHKNDVYFSVMGDGSLLNFMRKTDLYNLMTNALENAIEAVSVLSDPEKKRIAINIEAHGEMVTLVVRNYFDGTLNISGNELHSKKTYEIGEHGLGVKSMRLLAKKYGGDLNFTTQDDIFTLSVYMINKIK